MLLHRFQHREHRKGFTLIELIIVIAIIALLSALGGPALQAWMWKARLIEASRNIERKMNTVRKLSMANNTRHCIIFQPDSNYQSNGPNYEIGVNVAAESAPGSQTWIPVTAPPELAGWVNDQTTERFRGVSLEGGANINIFAFEKNGEIFT